jgi:hypothetical protein
MQEVKIRGFLIDGRNPPAPGSPSSTSSGEDGILVSVKVPEERGFLDCAWLMNAANVEFIKAGVNMRLVGLLAPTDDESEDEDSSSVPPAPWMIDPSSKLDTINLNMELEAVFMCEKLSVKTSSGGSSKVNASDFEFIRLLGEGAAGKVFQVRRRKTGKVRRTSAHKCYSLLDIRGEGDRKENAHG